MRKILITLLAITLFVNVIPAQSNRKLITEITQLQRRYKGASSLEYDIKYFYANEERPAAHVDSVIGKMQIKGNNYRIVLNNTETIKNDRYIIHLFKEDKLMYLTQPSSVTAASGPGELIDSAFANISNLSYTIDSNASTKRIVLNFPPQSSYKRIVLSINRSTGYLTNARYIVKTDQLLESKDQRDPTKRYDRFGVIDATFSNYRSTSDDPQLFDEKSVFIKNGREYQPVDKYKDFSIFLGSPNL